MILEEEFNLAIDLRTTPQVDVFDLENNGYLSLNEHSYTFPRLPEFKLYKPELHDPNWLELREEAHELAQKIAEVQKKPNKINNIRRKFRSLLTVGRNYLKNKSILDKCRDDYDPLYFVWTALNQCNFGCTYCDDHRGCAFPDRPDKFMSSIDRVEEMLEIMRTGCSSIYISGGEPTIRRDLSKAVRKAVDLNYFPIFLNTNCSLIADKLLNEDEWRDFLANIDVIVVSLDAMDLRDLTELWKTDNPQVVFRNLLMLRELSETYDFKLYINTVITPDTIHEASKVLDFANDMGIAFSPVPQNLGGFGVSDLQSIPAYNDLANKIISRKEGGYKVAGTFRMLENMLFDGNDTCRPLVKPHIDHRNRLVWPCPPIVNEEPYYLDIHRFGSLADAYEAGEEVYSGNQCASRCGAKCNWLQHSSTAEYHRALKAPLPFLREAIGALF